jgi:type I restriction enzyme S subunit
MRRYDSYKDSGVEWIGEIPSSWVKTKLKYKLQEVVTGGTPDTSNDSFWSDEDNGINWISISDITSNGREITETKRFISEKGLESKKLQILPIGSLIYSIYGSIGKVSRLGIPSTVHQGILGLKTNSTYNTTFLEYYLIYFKEYVSLFSSSNTQENLNQEKVSNFDVPVPPLSEQTEIVSYLDTKTSLIDSLIEKTQRKIELLKEKRTSLINEVVTKGLNPNVEMKDSGVEWIGEIPIEWNLVKLKQLFFINKRISGELGYDVLSVTQRGLKVKDLENNEGQHSMDYSKYQLVFESDFVMNHMDLLTGFVDLSKQVGVTSPDYRVFTKTKSDVVDIYYLYIFQLCYSRRIFYGLGSGVSNLGRWRLPSTEFLDFYIPYPSFTEQNEIVSYLDEHTQLIDKTISVEERRNELLKKYRQSLISEVVTGKRKVLN